MNKIIINDAEWIWVDKLNLEDSYAQFQFTLNYKGGNALIDFSCDGNCAVYVNEKLACFGQYPDFPHYKILETETLTEYLNVGNNEIKILVWRQGVLSSTYYVADSGLIFRVKIDGETVVSSDENILCRYDNNYKKGYKKYITPQLGLSFLYDANAAENEYKKAVLVDKSKVFYARPIKKVVLGERLKGEWITESILDFGVEKVGLLDLEFFSPKEQKITVTFAEHLTDGDVSRMVGIRDFSVEYVAKKGYNCYFNPFLRIGCRFIKFECEKKADVKYFGLKEVSYPFEDKKRPKLPSDLNDIYDACLRTLKLCAHEHYEDNPWREQSMYVLDSRNQMLCGYYAFKGFEYQRANLITIAKSQMENGLLSICSPSSKTMAIPSFSLIFPVAVREYIEHTKDLTILEEVYPTCKKIIDVFKNAIDQTGLIPHFEKPCWNFYEWSKDADGYYRESVERDYNVNPHYDLLCNATFLYSLDSFIKLAELTGESVRFDKATFKQKIKEFFKKGDKYVLADYSENYSKLGNSLIILTEIEENFDFLVDQIKNNDTIIDITLSMTTFLYDALLKADEKNSEYILSDIRDKYGYMLSCGSKTCWETILGEKDFDGAGSLCHGWSAMPIYYLNIFYGR